MNFFILNTCIFIYSKRMGLHESGEIDLDLLLFGGPDIDSTEPEEILCQCGRGRGLPRMVPRLPQAAILHRISLMEVNTSLYPAYGLSWHVCIAKIFKLDCISAQSDLLE